MAAGYATKHFLSSFATTPFWAHTDYSSSEEGAEDESDGDDDYDNHDGDDNGSLE